MGFSMTTGIEWTDETWNPIVGCSLVSPGCTNCYAMKFAGRVLDQVNSKARHYAGTTTKVKGNSVWTGKVALAPDHTTIDLSVMPIVMLPSGLEEVTKP
jgi:protein gp37